MAAHLQCRLVQICAENGYVSTYDLDDPRGAPKRLLEHRMF
jgi:hypothetical protein